MVAKKLSVLLVVVMLMTISIVVLIPKETVKASQSGGGEEITIDYQMIYNVTKFLSWRINQSYNIESGELAKGRDFGSKGEHDAAYYISQQIMANLGLYNPGLDPPYLEPIQSMNSTKWNTEALDNLSEELEITDIGIKLNDTTKIEGHIRPQWDLTALRAIKKYLNVNWTFPGLTFLGFNIFNTSKLTKNISYNNLTLRTRPTNQSWFWNFVFERNDTLFNALTNGSAYFLAVILSEFQDYYNFSIDELNPENASSNLVWFDILWDDKGINDDFLYISEDPAFNPNYTASPPLEEILEEIMELLPYINLLYFFQLSFFKKPTLY